MKRRICGMVRTGATGIKWVCVKAPHGAENVEGEGELVESTAFGTLFPESMRHHFVSADTFLAETSRTKPRTDVP